MPGTLRRTALRALGFALPAALTLVAVIAIYVPRAQSRAVDDWRARVSSIADDRALLLGDWVKRGLEKVTLSAHLPEVIAVTRGRRDEETLERLEAALQLVLRGHGAIVVADAEGRAVEKLPWVSTDPALIDELSSPTPACHAPSVQIRQGEHIRSVVVFAAPVVDPVDGRTGTLYLLDDARRSFFPILRMQLATTTGETLLVGRHGTNVAFLSPLRHRLDDDPRRYNMATTDLAGAVALRGEETFGRYVDYRGAAVLAATRRLEGTPWGLVVKVDEKEALGPVRRETLLLGITASAVAALLGMCAFAWYRQQRLRLLAATARSESERMSLLDHANDGILFREPDGTILDFNTRFSEMLGYSRRDLLGRHSRELRTEEQKKRWDESTERLLAEGSAVFETEVVHRDGHGVPIEVSSRLEDRDGRKIVVSVVRDISERRRAQAALQSLHDLFGAIIEGTTDAVFVKNLHGQYLVVNETIVRILGRPRVEVLGRDDRELFPPDVAETFLRGDRRVLETGDVETFEEEVAFEPGDVRTLHTTKGPIVGSQGDIVGVFGVARDITFRKLAERELREASARMELQVAALDAAGNAIVITDVTGGITWVNAAFERLTGYTRAEVLGKNPRVLKSGAHDDGFYERLWRTVLAGDVWRGELVNRRKDGSLYPEEMTITPVPGADGSITHFIAIKQDISERKAAQEALEKAEEQLRQAQKMEAVGRLAGGVAHDFNNLLGVILGNGEVVLPDLVPGGPEHEAVSEMVTAAKRGASLTRQLLAFSRRQVIQPRIIDLDGVVSGLDRMLRRVIGEDVELELRLRATSSRVRADPGQVEQVVMNLVVNARDAMPGGGRITIATRIVEVPPGRADGVSAGRHVELSVADTGVGMDAATLQRIFEPFFTTKPQGIGTGLGLATVYGIAKQGGGYVEVDSAPGCGATFRVGLPLVTTAIDELPAVASGASDARSRARILVVEDQDPLRRVIVRQLVRRGYEVLAAALPDEALHIAVGQSGPIDLLLTDVVMPQMSGPELAERLRATHPRLPVLFMSGYTSDVLVHKGVGEVVQILEKPFGADAMVRKVEEILAMARHPTSSARHEPEPVVVTVTEAPRR